jgi:hypothetical protein
MGRTVTVCLEMIADYDRRSPARRQECASESNYEALFEAMGGCPETLCRSPLHAFLAPLDREGAPHASAGSSSCEGTMSATRGLPLG